MSAQTIYDDLRRAGMTHEGACAMLGNMLCESSLKANIAQRGMTSLTDAQYTRLFDSNPERCINDGVGYGLCQWTHPVRKANLRQIGLGGSAPNSENHGRGSTFLLPKCILIRRALVAELVYALVSGASRATGVGSTPIQCTIFLRS